MTKSIADLWALFFGGGADAAYAELKALTDAGVTAQTLLTLASAGGVTTTALANSSVTSAKIADATIVNADVSETAAIAPTKVTAPTRATSVVAETYPRGHSIGAGTFFTTGTLNLTGIYLAAGTVVSHISAVCVTTPLSVGSNQWFCLYDKNRGKLAVTNDDTSVAWSAAAVKTLFVSRRVTDATITSGAATVTSATAAFTANDVGKEVTFLGAGAAGAPLGTSASAVTISSVTNATTAVLSSNASTSVASGGTLDIATPYTVPTTDFYYVGGCVVASTAPSLGVMVSNATVTALAPVISGRGDASLTTPATAPPTAASLSSLSNIPYFYLT